MKKKTFGELLLEKPKEKIGARLKIEQNYFDSQASPPGPYLKFFPGTWEFDISAYKINHEASTDYEDVCIFRVRTGTRLESPNKGECVLSQVAFTYSELLHLIFSNYQEAFYLDKAEERILKALNDNILISGVRGLSDWRESYLLKVGTDEINLYNKHFSPELIFSLYKDKDFFSHLLVAVSSFHNRGTDTHISALILRLPLLKLLDQNERTVPYDCEARQLSFDIKSPQISNEVSDEVDPQPVEVAYNC